MGKVRPRAAATMGKDAVYGVRHLLFWKIA